MAPGREAAAYSGFSCRRKKRTVFATQTWHVTRVKHKTIAVIGAGPAGLIAAEILSPHAQVIVLDRMPSAGRKLLMAGRGGLNLTHIEPIDGFTQRYASPRMAACVAAHPPQAMMEWATGLGQEIFTGSSGRVFPRAMKSSPLLRAWLARLAGLGVTLRTHQSWQGWANDGGLAFDGPDGSWTMQPDATVLALGGASWPRLGSNGQWQEHFPPSELRPFTPSNMGFVVGWSDIFRTRFAGTPLKRIGLRLGDRSAMGEAMVTAGGIEGGVIYTLSAAIRDAIAREGGTTLHLDLRPDLSHDILATRIADRGSQSLSNHLRSKGGLAPVAIGLVQEALHAGATAPLAELIKALPIRVSAAAPIDRAISSAGGLKWDALDDRMMLRSRPGVFAAGEMLDWEAPTGGYLLQGCYSTGRAAAQGVLDWMGPA